MNNKITYQELNEMKFGPLPKPNFNTFTIMAPSHEKLQEIEKKWNGRFQIKLNYSQINITDTQNNNKLWQKDIKITTTTNFTNEIKQMIKQIIEDTRNTKLNDIL